MPDVQAMAGSLPKKAKRPVTAAPCPAPRPQSFEAELALYHVGIKVGRPGWCCRYHVLSASAPWVWKCLQHRCCKLTVDCPTF